MKEHDDLTEAVKDLTRSVEALKNELACFRSHLNCVTTNDLKSLEDKIISAISDFAAKQNAFNDRMDKAITDLQGDVQSLNDQIAALQASGGAITPEDQALLDGLQTRAQGIADKLDALDALTPPAPPATP